MDTFVRRYEQVDSTTTLSLSFFLSLSLPSPPLLNPRPLLCDDMSRFKVLSFHPPSSLTPLILAGPVSSPHPLTPFPSFRSLLCDDINNRWTLISSWAPATVSSLQVPEYLPPLITHLHPSSPYNTPIPSHLFDTLKSLFVVSIFHLLFPCGLIYLLTNLLIYQFTSFLSFLTS